ncbi:Peroxyureidoacrylate/ureidoacrylate amidohydrolase RutB [Baekduia alba]|uniref:cysteine hydrolase family protein n=1 Tax=Baekduia alba TaxID=2997333 RepID=UPI0023424F98|nr:isochorismatase family cysteine hydrolase [Baekduia alba]WCB91607.1 Peroxyureidoacrylate/ureidoacrylate amidohydrolase RutB [Baekduia alba]
MADTLDVPEIPHTENVALDPAKTALVVVDMQNDFVADDGSLQVPDARATVPVIAALVARFRAAGARIVFTQDTHRAGDPEFAIWPVHAVEGTAGWAIVEELTPLPEDTVIRKPRYDAFYGTALDHLLRQWGVSTLVICGTVANICVHYTASSAALRWYGVVIPRDAVSALDPFDLAASLRQTTSLLAGRVTTAGGIDVA